MAMSVGAAAAGGPAAGTGAAAADVAIEVVRDLPSIEPVWRWLEERAVATPYQRFDWVRSYADAAPGIETRVVVVRDAGGPVMLVPLELRRRAGVAIASFIGDKHKNFGMPVLCRAWAARLTAAEQRRLLVAAGRRIGADALVLEHVPPTWDGEPVALAAGGRPSPSDAYGVTLDADGPSSLRLAMSSDGRRKLRNRAKNLGKIGPVAHVTARTPAEIDPILDAFFRQKSERFREQGIADPFAGSAEAFIRAACLAGLEAGRPAIELSAITVGGKVAAVFGAAVDDRRTSGMFISFDPEFARLSPGDQMVAWAIGASAERGRAVFDLGVGEAEYKRRFCREPHGLVDVTIPVTAKGRLYLAALSSAMVAKRAVKRSESAMGALRVVRRLVGRLGG